VEENVAKDPTGRGCPFAHVHVLASHPKDDESCSSSRNEMGMRREEEKLEWPVHESDRKNLAYGASQQEKTSAGHCTERHSSIYHPNLEICHEDPTHPLKYSNHVWPNKSTNLIFFLCRNI